MKTSKVIRYREIAFVAYPVTNMARARKFYEGVLGLKPTGLVKRGAKWVEYEIGSGTLAIGSSDQWLPSNDGPCAALEVEDFEAAVAIIRKNKVSIAMGPLDFPSCQMVAVRDPDSNKITLHRRKSAA